MLLPNLACHVLPEALGLALAPIFANWFDHTFAFSRTSMGCRARRTRRQYCDRDWGHLAG